MICLSSAGSLAPFDGGGSDAGRTKKGALAAARCARGWEADARSQEASPVNPDRHEIERHISDRRRSRGDATSTPMGTARAHLEATPPERQPGKKPSRRPERTPRTPQLQPVTRNRMRARGRLRPRPRGGGATEVGWELHSKEHTSKRNLEMPCAFKVSMIH